MFLLFVIFVYLIRINEAYDMFENVVKLFLINFLSKRKKFYLLNIKIEFII